MYWSSLETVEDSKDELPFSFSCYNHSDRRKIVHKLFHCPSFGRKVTWLQTKNSGLVTCPKNSLWDNAIEDPEQACYFYELNNSMLCEDTWLLVGGDSVSASTAWFSIPTLSTEVGDSEAWRRLLYIIRITNKTISTIARVTAIPTNTAIEFAVSVQICGKIRERYRLWWHTL
jgi:hypothetical protein